MWHPPPPPPSPPFCYVWIPPLPPKCKRNNWMAPYNSPSSFLVDTGRKLTVQKTSRRRPGRLLNVLCTFNLRPVSTGLIPLKENFHKKRLWKNLIVIFGRDCAACVKLTTKRCEICSKFTKKHQNDVIDDVIDFVLVYLLLTVNIFHTFLVLLSLTLNK